MIRTLFRTTISDDRPYREREKIDNTVAVLSRKVTMFEAFLVLHEPKNGWNSTDEAEKAFDRWKREQEST